MDNGHEEAPDQPEQEYAIQPAGRLPLTDQCHHYEGQEEVPWDIQKYFSQRYSIFSSYDEGVYMTDDAWFGVTPEPVANHVAKDMEAFYQDSGKNIIIDLFAGAGGNSIAFAHTWQWDRVISVEKDAATLACAQSNAEVYGFDSDTTHISWVHGDSFEFLDALLNHPEKLHPDLRVDVAKTVLFASPPWGGPGYRSDEVFDLNGMQPYNLAKLHGAYQRLDHALFLPRTSDVRQVAKMAPPGEKIEVVQYCMEGASKAMVAYVPGSDKPASTQDEEMS